MNNKFLLKKCNKCGALVEVLQDCTCENCGVKCCNEEMKPVLENSVDCAVEKHKPEYKIVGNYIVVNVNHVMEADHLINFVEINAENLTAKKFFKAGEQPVAIFPYVKGSKVYAYCNKHGLWSTVVE